MQELLIAADEGDVPEVTRLIAAGANVDAMDDNGNTPLIRAAIKGHVSVIR